MPSDEETQSRGTKEEMCAIKELPKVFYERELAKLLLSQVDFPNKFIPASNEPITFWHHVIEKISHGARSGCLSRLFEEAAVLFPRNEAFAPYRRHLHPLPNKDLERGYDPESEHTSGAGYASQGPVDTPQGPVDAHEETCEGRVSVTHELAAGKSGLIIRDPIHARPNPRKRPWAARGLLLEATLFAVTLFLIPSLSTHGMELPAEPDRMSYECVFLAHNDNYYLIPYSERREEPDRVIDAPTDAKRRSSRRTRASKTRRALDYGCEGTLSTRIEDEDRKKKATQLCREPGPPGQPVWTLKAMVGVTCTCRFDFFDHGP